MPFVIRNSDDAYTHRALAFEGGHLFVHAGGYTLYHAPGCTLSGYAIEAFKAWCTAAGLVVIDTRALDPGVAFRLAADTPMAAGSYPADPPPWTGTSWAPLRDVAALYRTAGAEVSNLPPG